MKAAAERPRSSITCSSCGAGLVDVRLSQEDLAALMRIEGWAVTSKSATCRACHARARGEVRINGMPSDPPPLGTVKLKIVSDGTPEGTRVIAVDHHGIERDVLNVDAARWQLRPPEFAVARIEVLAPEVQLEAAVFVPEQEAPPGVPASPPTLRSPR